MITTFRKYAMTGAAVLALSACATEEPAAEEAAAAPAEDAAAVRSAIEAAVVQWEQAVAAGDAAAVAALYDENGTLMPPNSETVQGREGIQKVFESFGAMGIKSFDLEVVEVESAGDLAFEVGKYTAFAQPEGAPEPVAVDNGKYIVVWKKQADGSWKLYRDIFNTSMPAPAAH